MTHAYENNFVVLSFDHSLSHTPLFVVNRYPNSKYPSYDLYHVYQGAVEPTEHVGFTPEELDQYATLVTIYGCNLQAVRAERMEKNLSSVYDKPQAVHATHDGATCLCGHKGMKATRKWVGSSKWTGRVDDFRWTQTEYRPTLLEVTCKRCLKKRDAE